MAAGLRPVAYTPFCPEQRMRRLVLPAVCLVLSLSTAAAAEPFDVRVHGNFTQMTHTGDARSVVALAEIGSQRGTYGVGALAGLRGEILLWDGKLLVTRGHSETGKVSPPAPGDEAALFVQGKVDAWDEVVVPSDMTQAEFEAFVVATAAKRGLGAEQAFPFAVRGALPRVEWHVVTGAASGERKHGDVHAQGHARNRTFDHASANAVLLGFHSGVALEGVISHPGERFHLHYADAAFTVSGHVDAYRVGKGALLMLPR
jgi:alpha-acetolactate decarboxylase